jgi:HlyD family secretion protein
MISSAMSAFPSTPQPTPEPPRLVPAPERPRSKGIIFFFLILLLGGAIWYFRPKQEDSSRNVSVTTIKAVRGSIESTRRLAGSITAARFANITVPILQAPDSGRGLTLTYLATNGSLVNEGELLAEIDAADMRDHLSDVEAQVSQFELDIRKRKTVQVAEMEALRQRIRVAKADLLKSKEDLKALDVRSAITQEVLKLAAEQAQAMYDQVLQELPLTEERQRAEMAVTMIDYERQLRHRNRHRHDLEHFRISSPLKGMVVLQTTNRNGELNQIRVGDMVAPGQPFIRVVDPNSMQLEANMNQTEVELVHLGQPATIHFDAFPDMAVSGQVRGVGALAVGSRRVNYYIRRIPVRVGIDRQDARVIPDLSASADIQTDTAEGLILPREAVTEAAGKPVVYVRQENGFAPREVEIAGANPTQVAVTGGLQEGDEIALAPHSVISPE